MLEQIKSQLQSPRYLTASENYLGLKRELWPKISSDLYPLTSDYYHDLNPFFSYNIANFDFFKTYPVVTFRDGGFSTAAFYSQNFSRMSKSKQTILVHEDVEHFVPDQLKDRTLSYKMAQPRRISIEEAKQVIVIGVLSDQMLVDREKILKKLQILKQVSEKARIKIFLQTRKSPFETAYNEPLLALPLMYELFSSLKSKPEFIPTSTIFTTGLHKETYIININSDRYLLSDSFTDYIYASKGATIHEWDHPSDSSPLATLPISLFHQMEINPIKKRSVFNEIVFTKKTSALPDALFDPYLFAKFKELF